MSFPDKTIDPVKFKEIFAGELGWNMKWVEDLTPIPDEIGNGYGESLRNKLLFFQVVNGDYLCLDMSIETGSII